MAEKPTGKDIAKAFLKTSVTFNGNRCQKCGRRLKYKPGAWITSTEERFTTCRSCGFENPTLLEKVAETLKNSGFDIPQSIEGVLDLPQCLSDGTELQVSRDFTKVFCSMCGREWDRFEFEDLLGGPLSPQLAGAIPINFDTSRVAQNLERLLQMNQIDAGTPYLVLEVVEIGSEYDVPLGKGLIASFKKGLRAGIEGTKGAHTDEKVSLYLAIYSDLIALYTAQGENLRVEEVPYTKLFKDSKSEPEIPFNVRPIAKFDSDKISSLLTRFRTMEFANSSPYKPNNFGSAAKQAQRQTE